MNARNERRVYFKDSRSMDEVPDESVQLIITSPPYFNIKNYALDGYQQQAHSGQLDGQIGDIQEYDTYIASMLEVWRECERVLQPNGKLVINTPLMPMLKRDFNTHHNRHIFDINSDIQQSILGGTGLFLMDTYFWNRLNPSKSLMFGSYPYPANFYAQNTTEFITVYVRDGAPRPRSSKIKELSKLTQEEWVNYTRQIWDINIPNKSDIAFGKHSAIMPEEIPYRLIKLFSFVGDVVLDPFAGSGTTLKVACELGREYIGYEIMESYRDVIYQKLSAAQSALVFQE